MNDYTLDEMFPSRYFKAADFPYPKILTLSSVSYEDIDGKGEHKYVARFSGETKGWVLNRTNSETMGAAWGKQTSGWIGKQIELFSMTVSGPKGPVPGIRCRVPAPAPAPAAAPAAPPAAAPAAPEVDYSN